MIAVSIGSTGSHPVATISLEVRGPVPVAGAHPKVQVSPNEILTPVYAATYFPGCGGSGSSLAG